jgi:outer membrane protein
MNKKVLFVLFSLWAMPAAAQQGSPLTLQEAEQRALDKNPSIAAARLATQGATFTVVETRAAYRPLFTTTIAQRSQTNPGTTQLSGGREVTNDALTFGTSVSQVLPWGGGSVSVDVSGSRNATSNAFATYNPSFSSGVTFSFVQPLFGGRSFDATRAAIEQAEIGSDIADVALRRETASTLAGVRRAYWELVYAMDALETARESEALAQRQLDENRRRAELGTIAQVDVVEAEAEVAARHQAVVQAEGAWRTAQVTLKQLMVADAGDPIWNSLLTPVDRPEATTRTIDVPSAIERAVSNRSDAQIARKERESAATAVNLLGEQTKPSVDLVAQYGVNGIGGTQILRQAGVFGSDIVGTSPGGYLDVLRSIGALDYPTWSVGLNVNVPLGNSAAQAALARAKVQQRQLNVGIQALEVAIAGQVTRIAEQVRSAEEQIRAAAAARALAQKRLDAEEAPRGGTVHELSGPAGAARSRHGADR